MGSELPNLWWLLSPEFIKAYCEDRRIEGDEDNHYTVAGELEERMRQLGDYPDLKNGRLQSTSVIELDSMVHYRQLLLQKVSTAKHSPSDPVPQVNIIISIPKNYPSLAFMREIINVTRGVRSFIKPVVTFVDFEYHIVTVNI